MIYHLDKILKMKVMMIEVVVINHLLTSLLVGVSSKKQLVLVKKLKVGLHLNRSSLKVDLV